MNNDNFKVMFDFTLNNYVISDGENKIVIDHDRMKKFLLVICDTDSAREALRTFIDAVEDGSLV